MMTASRSSPFYWYATRWYDGSLSTYRWWAPDFPHDKYASCICYTAEGWLDAPCDSEFYFVVEMPAGSSVFLSWYLV